ncbi:hypothetical protein, partial [Salmonella enterica]|uniref:hypothetical protein n=1 Tax=Salmonella enterica TaxID=28901 RepID=UPI003EDC4411
SRSVDSFPFLILPPVYPPLLALAAGGFHPARTATSCKFDWRTAAFMAMIFFTSLIAVFVLLAVVVVHPIMSFPDMRITDALCACIKLCDGISRIF